MPSHSDSTLLKNIAIDEHIVQLIVADDETCLKEAIAGTSVDPYWGTIWKSATPMARCVMRLDWSNERAIELGCGVGLVGIAGLLAGLDVTFTDHEPRAVEFALSNAERNGHPNCRGIPMDWRKPVDEKYEAILASDILYDVSMHGHLLGAAAKLLAPHGRMFIGDPGRFNALDFAKMAEMTGWNVSVYDEDLNERDGPSTAPFQLLRLSRQLEISSDLTNPP